MLNRLQQNIALQFVIKCSKRLKLKTCFRQFSGLDGSLAFNKIVLEISNYNTIFVFFFILFALKNTKQNHTIYLLHNLLH